MMQKEAIVYAYALASRFEQEKDIDVKKLFQQETLLEGLSYSDVDRVLDSFPPNAKKENVSLACLLCFVLLGKKPEEAFPDAVKKEDDCSFSRINLGFRDLIWASQKGDPVLSSTLTDLRKSWRSASCGRAIAPYVQPYPGFAKVLEMLYETFATKYSLYSGKSYVEILGKMKDKDFSVRCEDTIDSPVKASSVSVFGTLEKPMHNSCEDFSGLYSYCDVAPLVLGVVADGVGSVLYSSTGSRYAFLAAKDVIERKLRRMGYSNKIRSPKRVADRVHGIEPYFKALFARDFFARWVEFLKADPDFASYFAEHSDPDYTDFASTFAFVFITPTETIIGKIGDGKAYLRKKEMTLNGEAIGLFRFTDGYSGVVQTSVYGTPHLKKNPGLFHIESLPTKQVKDVLLASDGLDAIIQGDSEALGYMAEFDSLPLGKLKERITELAKRGADVNLSFGGVGDDSSLLYIDLSKED